MLSFAEIPGINSSLKNLSLFQLLRSSKMFKAIITSYLDVFRKYIVVQKHKR